MRKLVPLALVLVLLMLATSVVSAGPEPVGGQINVLFGTPTTYLADEPFHILHGYNGLDMSELKALGKYDFVLEVDGVLQKKGFLSVTVEDGLMARSRLHNFPEGLPAGDHTFVGHWYGPCTYPDPGCPRPNAQVEVFTNSLTVTFGP